MARLPAREVALDEQRREPVGGGVDRGGEAGRPGTDTDLPTPKATASRVRAWWRELGFPVEQLSAAVTLTPACGLAGATPAYAKAVLKRLAEAAAEV